MKRFLLIIAMSIGIVSAGNSVTAINPVSQTMWPRITSNGIPTSPCTSSNYGQPFQDTSVTTNKIGSCGTDGWAYRGGSSGAGFTANAIQFATSSSITRAANFSDIETLLQSDPNATYICYTTGPGVTTGSQSLVATAGGIRVSGVGNCSITNGMNLLIGDSSHGTFSGSGTLTVTLSSTYDVVPGCGGFGITNATVSGSGSSVVLTITGPPGGNYLWSCMRPTQ